MTIWTFDLCLECGACCCLQVGRVVSVDSWVVGIRKGAGKLPLLNTINWGAEWTLSCFPGSCSIHRLPRDRCILHRWDLIPTAGGRMLLAISGDSWGSLEGEITQ